MKRLLLCTDLDRTLLPNGAAPEAPDARPQLARLAAHPDLTLVYVTGRDRLLVEEAMERWDLPEPDLVIGDVGTTIAARRDGLWQAWAAWESELSASWHGHTAGDLRPMVGELPGLELQAPARQNTFKLSYTTPLGAAGQALSEQVRDRLSVAGVEANVIWSVDEGRGEGLLDVLPPTATKRLALEYVMEQTGYVPAEVLFAGDSGNDLDVLVSPIPAVLVANASEAVRREAERRAVAEGCREALLCAGGEDHYALGILAGVRHFHPAWMALLEGLA